MPTGPANRVINYSRRGSRLGITSGHETGGGRSGFPTCSRRWRFLAPRAVPGPGGWRRAASGGRRPVPTLPACGPMPLCRQSRCRGRELGDHSNWRPPPESLNAIGDAKIDCFEHFWQPSGREAAPLCYPPTAPSGQMQQCPLTCSSMPMSSSPSRRPAGCRRSMAALPLRRRPASLARSGARGTLTTPRPAGSGASRSLLARSTRVGLSRADGGLTRMQRASRWIYQRWKLSFARW
jgi:hypothetical protein